MSKENHFVAEVYSHLWPWIVHDKTLAFCLDDGGQGGSSTPDLCFQFVGNSVPMRIECKIIYSENKGKAKKKDHLKAYRKQLLTWATPSAASPLVWVAKREDAEQYYLWRHDHPQFLANFAAQAAEIDPTEEKDKNRLVQVPASILADPLTFAGLFHRIWSEAIAAGALKERNP